MPAPKSIAEIDDAINKLEQQNMLHENRIDLLSNQPRGTDLEVANLESQIRSNQEEIDKLKEQKAALGGGSGKS